MERLLLGVEVGAVVIFLGVGGMLWQTRRELNESYRNLQRNAPQMMPTFVAAANPGMLPETGAQASQPSFAAPPMPTAIPTVTPQAVVDAARDREVAEADVPFGQQNPTFEQSGNSARNVRFDMQKRAPLAEPPSRRLRIPAIDVDNFIYQYSGPQSLKLGVVQFGQPVAPGETGNLVLAAHNDIYGEVFRDLDQLKGGDELVLMGENGSHTYRVSATLIVDPDDAWVMRPTSTPTLTLVSCYPYIVDSHRIVVFAELAQ